MSTSYSFSTGMLGLVTIYDNSDHASTCCFTGTHHSYSSIIYEGLIGRVEGDKVQLVLCTQPTGAAAVTVRIRAYNATGELDIRRDPFTLGTRVLLTCDVTGLPDDSASVRYRWYHNCLLAHRVGERMCEIRDTDSYYRIVSDTLLVDVTSWNQGGKYYCSVRYQQQMSQRAITPSLSVTG